jgi:FkbM family methyltransferase
MASAPPRHGGGSLPSSSSTGCRDCSLLVMGFIAAVSFATWWSGPVQQRAPAKGLPGGPLAPKSSSSSSSQFSSALSFLSSERGASAVAASPPEFRTFLRDICNDTERYPEEPPEYDIMGRPGSSTEEWDAPDCHWSEMFHPAVPMKPMNVCTHDPEIDTVISKFLHTYHFWGSPDDYLILLATGPCSEERPYMLDIGANLGVYSIMGASRGCRIVAFEPLSQNILRLKASLERNGWGHRALLYKHAVGKMHATVRIGFRPSNPGASALGHGGDEVEVIDQITIDNLLLGKDPPKFKDKGAKGLPPLLGERGTRRAPRARPPSHAQPPALYPAFRKIH